MAVESFPLFSWVPCYLLLLLRQKIVEGENEAEEEEEEEKNEKAKEAKEEAEEEKEEAEEVENKQRILE